MFQQQADFMGQEATGGLPGRAVAGKQLIPSAGWRLEAYGTPAEIQRHQDGLRLRSPRRNLPPAYS